MNENGRVHPDCVKSSNPYHECGVACLEKISQGKGRKEKKKSDHHHGVNEGWVSKNKDGERRAQPACPKASNPYHKCEEFCSNRTAETNLRGVKKQSERAQPCPRASNPYHKCEEFCSNGTSEANPREVKKQSGSILDAALSFGRKKKESESQQSSRGAVNNVPAVNAAGRGQSPPSTLPIKKDEEPENIRSFSSSQQHSDESYSEDSFDKGRFPGPVHVSGNITPDPPKSPIKLSLACYKIPTPAEPQQNGTFHGSPKAAPYPSANNEGEVTNGPFTEYNFSGISHASEESDDEEAQSVISDSCVSVGKYHVRENVASILQLIFNKYGDIAAGSRLESASMRAYYLECLCFVVQELQCTPFKQLTKSKVREMLAVLKDVESAQIDVSWLRDILNDLAEGMELSSQHQAADVAKSNCDHAIESIMKELESMVEDLAQKESAVADAKAQIDETRANLSKLELESSRLGETISSLRSTVEKFHDKHLADELL